jgi:hypothetical protein
VAQHWFFGFYFTVKKKARATHEKLSVFDSLKTVKVRDVTKAVLGQFKSDWHQTFRRCSS